MAIRGKKVEFSSAEEMLKAIQDGKDFYNPYTGIYVFVYNDAGSIAYYSLDESEAEQLQKMSDENDGEYWGAFLGWGGWIVDDPSYEDFDPVRQTNLEWCEEVYSDYGWLCVIGD